MKILVVDDDLGTINALNAGLTSFGFEVITAPDGFEALKIFNSLNDGIDPVDLLVTDLKMPKMNGLELVKAARKINPELRAIIITAYGDYKVRKEVMEMTRSRYIEKPFNGSILLSAIKELFNYPDQQNEEVSDEGSK